MTCCVSSRFCPWVEGSSWSIIYSQHTTTAMFLYRPLGGRVLAYWPMLWYYILLFVEDIGLG